MKAVRLVVVGALAALALSLLPGVSPAAGSLDATGRYIVVLENGSDAAAMAAAHTARLGLEITHVYEYALQGYAAAMPASVASVVESLPGVEWVEQDRVVRATAQTLPTGINRAQADLSPTANINGSDERVNVDVAVIDTGVNTSHADLNVHVAGQRNCVTPLLSANDDNGHGSHVAGTIGAIDNANGVVGMAPGARIWPVKVLNAAGAGLVSQIVCGIDYVASRAAEIEVANMSLGGGGSDDGNCGNSNNDSEHRAICGAVAAGVTFVVAAGNESQNAANVTPAAYDEVITVSALADSDGLTGGAGGATCSGYGDDTFAAFSNFGADVDIIAPGDCIYSTSFFGGYATLSGTSMAAPHVSGAAALFKANNPSATPAQVRAALIGAGTTDWNNAGDRDGIKEPLLNAANL